MEERQDRNDSWQSRDTNYRYDYGNQNYNGEGYGNVPPYHYGNVPPAQGDRKLGIEIASLVLGILSIVFLCCGCWGAYGLASCLLVMAINLVMGILAVVFAVKTKNRKKSGMATGGMVCGIIGIVLTVIVTSVLLLAVSFLSKELGPDWEDLSEEQLEERMEEWLENNGYSFDDYDGNSL